MTLSKTSHAEDLEIISLYVEQMMTYREIASRYGVSHEYIRRVIQHYGIVPRENIASASSLRRAISKSLGARIYFSSKEARVLRKLLDGEKIVSAADRQVVSFLKARIAR